MLNDRITVTKKHIDAANVVVDELTYRETPEAQLFGQKEEMTEFRKKILEREHKMVQALRSGCHMFFDFDAMLDKYHL